MPGKPQMKQFPGAGERIKLRLLRHPTIGTAVALGRQTGLSRQTLHRAMNEDTMTHETARAIAQALGMELGEVTGELDPFAPDASAWLRGRPQPRAMPQELRVLAKRFELEASELGADDFALAFIRTTLSSPEAVSMYHGGYSEPLSIEAMRTRQDAIIRGLRLWLDEYLMQQREAKRR
jgi:hypothetical protein